MSTSGIAINNECQTTINRENFGIENFRLLNFNATYFCHWNNRQKFFDGMTTC